MLKSKGLFLGLAQTLSLPLIYLAMISPARADTFINTGPLATGRYYYTATRLIDGNGPVLIAGGQTNAGSYLATVELYDPDAGTWSTTNSMAVGRRFHTATLLPSGQVLVAGGQGSAGYLSSAEIYDPEIGTWADTGSMPVTRYTHTATLLTNGLVLVAGGYGSGGYLSSAVLYDPNSLTWTNTGSMSTARRLHVAALLPNGKVLVAGGTGSGGHLSSAEIYNPSNGTWTSAGSMTTQRYWATATLLQNGKVLVAGGQAAGGYLSSAELYDPVLGTWAATGSMGSARNAHAAALLWDGKVLIAGGQNGTNACLCCAWVYDPAVGTWTNCANMGAGRTYHAATTLGNGSVLMAAGSGTGGGLASAELFQAAPQAAPAPPTNVRVGPGPGAPVLSWTPSTGAASYKVYRCPVNDRGNGVALPFVLRATLTPPYIPDPTDASRLSYTDINAGTETVFQYYVTAVNASAQESVPSSKAYGMSTYRRRAKLLISEILANPSGTDSPKEWVELVATDNINFAQTPYCVVFIKNGAVDEDGWIGGAKTTYGFNITSGNVLTGKVVYVGGSSMTAGTTAPKVRVINTGTTPGDRFGDVDVDELGLPTNDGVLGNGSANVDGVAVFATDIWNLKAGTVPVDAVFFGAGTAGTPGTAVYDYQGSEQGHGGFELPLNDRYTGGKLTNTSPFELDPGGGDVLVATGAYNPYQDKFATVRSWAVGTHSDGTSGITVTQPAANRNLRPAFTGIPERFSGAVWDITNPQLKFTVTPTPSAIPTATSSDTAVVPNANISITGQAGNYTLSINPIAVGSTLITVSAVANGFTSTIIMQYRASDVGIGNGNPRLHTFSSDASASYPLDATYMLVADDEDQVLRIYKRYASGPPVRMFDITRSLLPTPAPPAPAAARKLGGNHLKEVDIEAATSMLIGGTRRIFWIAALANEDDTSPVNPQPAPNRNRLFATDLTGTDINTWNVTYVGRYDFLREDLIAWDHLANRVRCDGSSIPQDYYGLVTSADPGQNPKDAAGFNVEGLAIAPDGTTAYIGLRAPQILPPPANPARNRALIVPLLNLNALVANPGGGAPNSAVFGPPIELDLGARGIRSIEGNAHGMLIVAGIPQNPPVLPDFRLYTWTGLCGDPPEERVANSLLGLNPESIVEIPPGPLTANTEIQLLSDNGRTIWYGEGIKAKALPDPFTKFRSDTVFVGPVVPKPVETFLVDDAFPAGAVTGFSGPMKSARYGFTATLLNNGKVLVAGGNNGTSATAAAELYDPATDTWSSTQPMLNARAGHTATLLSDGRVLVVGASWGSASAELYNPSSGSWSAAAGMGIARQNHTATRLSDGKVLVAGGDGIFRSSELYNPATDSWSQTTGYLGSARESHSATLLANGMVLVAGGYFNNTATASAELYNPASGTWSYTGPMSRYRFSHTATLLADGKVLAVGCSGDCGSSSTAAELYNPTLGTWSGAGPMATPRYAHTATLLSDGRVMIAGGVDSSGMISLRTAEIYNAGTWTTVAPMATPRVSHTAAYLSNGKVLVAGGVLLSSAEFYDPVANTWSPSGGNLWTWVTSNPSPFRGSQSHQSDIAAGQVHGYFFAGATQPLTLYAGESLIAYVYIDPANIPTEIMLHWHSTGPSAWEHRAYWGQDLIGSVPNLGSVGIEGTTTRIRMGPLPPVGQWVRLEVPAKSVGLEGHAIDGMAFTLYGGRATWDAAGKSTASSPSPQPEVWVGDYVPVGSLSAAESDSWNWIASSPSPFSGSLAHQSTANSGFHQHYFNSAIDVLALNNPASEKLIAYVYLPSSGGPQEIMLQWRSATSGLWDHRAFWGNDLIGLGTLNTPSRRNMGSLPNPGQWARLEVSASQVDLEGHVVDGMAFTLFDGFATWDHAGKTLMPGPALVLHPCSIEWADEHEAATTSWRVEQQYEGGAWRHLSMVNWWDWDPEFDPGPYTGLPCTASSGTYRFRVRGEGTGGQPTTEWSVTANVGISSQPPATDTVWIEDGLPAGAVAGAESEGWTWVSSGPTPVSGSQSHQSSAANQWRQHSFDSATATLTVNANEKLIAYVYIDPTLSPRQIMLQWRSASGGGWEHRAYWGESLLPYGAPGTASRRYMGPLPAAGQWSRLEVPAGFVGLEGHVLQGMAFTVYDGRATWDHVGKFILPGPVWTQYQWFPAPDYRFVIQWANGYDAPTQWWRVQRQYGAGAWVDWDLVSVTAPYPESTLQDTSAASGTYRFRARGETASAVPTTEWSVSPDIIVP